jgi:hypothetical protein
MREHHVKRVHTRNPDVGEHVALITPVDLGLGAGDDLEAAVQPGQRVLINQRKLGGDQWSGLSQVHLGPLVVTGEAVLGYQPLVDHRRLQRDVGTKPRLDHRDERGDDLRLGARPRRH